MHCSRSVHYRPREREWGSQVYNYIYRKRGGGTQVFVWHVFLLHIHTKGVIMTAAVARARGRLAICATRRDTHTRIPDIIALGRARAASPETSDLILLASGRAPTGRASSLLRPSCVCVYTYIYVSLTHSLTHSHVHTYTGRASSLLRSRTAASLCWHSPAS